MPNFTKNDTNLSAIPAMKYSDFTAEKKFFAKLVLKKTLLFKENRV